MWGWAHTFIAGSSRLVFARYRAGVEQVHVLPDRVLCVCLHRPMVFGTIKAVPVCLSAIVCLAFAELWSYDGERHEDGTGLNRIHHHSGRRPYRSRGEQRKASE